MNIAVFLTSPDCPMHTLKELEAVRENHIELSDDFMRSINQNVSDGLMDVSIDSNRANSANISSQ